MTATLSQSQAELPHLVELASRGEDVVITVDGRPKARLTRAVEPGTSRFRAGEIDRWMAELAAFRGSLTTGKSTPTAEQLINEDRADRA